MTTQPIVAIYSQSMAAESLAMLLGKIFGIDIETEKPKFLGLYSCRETAVGAIRFIESLNTEPYTLQWRSNRRNEPDKPLHWHCSAPGRYYTLIPMDVVDVDDIDGVPHVKFVDQRDTKGSDPMERAKFLKILDVDLPELAQQIVDGTALAGEVEIP